MSRLWLLLPQVDSSSLRENWSEELSAAGEVHDAMGAEGLLRVLGLSEEADNVEFARSLVDAALERASRKKDETSMTQAELNEFREQFPCLRMSQQNSRLSASLPQPAIALKLY